MLDRTLFIGKILLVSALLSVAIKYLAPFLSLSPTPLNTLVLVLAPTIVLALALWRRAIDS